MMEALSAPRMHRTLRHGRQDEASGHPEEAGDGMSIATSEDMSTFEDDHSCYGDDASSDASGHSGHDHHSDRSHTDSEAEDDYTRSDADGTFDEDEYSRHSQCTHDSDDVHGDTYDSEADDEDDGYGSAGSFSEGETFEETVETAEEEMGLGEEGDVTFEDDERIGAENDDETSASPSPRRPAPHMRSGRMTTTAAAVIAAATAGLGGAVVSASSSSSSSPSSLLRQTESGSGSGSRKSASGASAAGARGEASMAKKTAVGRRGGQLAATISASTSTEAGASLTAQAQERRERRKLQKQRERGDGGSKATSPSGDIVTLSPSGSGGKDVEMDMDGCLTAVTPSTAASSGSASDKYSFREGAGGGLGTDAAAVDVSIASSVGTTEAGDDYQPSRRVVPIFFGGGGGNGEAGHETKIRFLIGTEEDDDGEEKGALASSEFSRLTEATKREWDVGTARNSRYNPSTSRPKGMVDGDGSGRTTPLPLPPIKAKLADASAVDGGASDASVPSGVFHINAKEAIRALLTSPGGDSAYGSVAASSVGGGGGGGVSTRTEDRYQYSPGMPRDDESSVAGPTGNVSDLGIPILAGVSNNILWSDQSGYVRPLTESLLRPETEAKLETLHERMVRPSAQLADLIVNIRRPMASDDATGVTREVAIDRGCMTRRKNACGAVKVLLSKKGNRVPLCWSVGLLTALTSVLNDSGPEGAEKEYASDRMTYAAYIEARKRAVAALVSMSGEPENRVIMFHSPGLVQALGKVIREERAECRRGCSAVLAHLSRAPENRLILPKIPGIIEAMEWVLRPPGLGDDGKKGEEAKAGASAERVKRLMKKWSSGRSADGENEDDDDDDDDKSVSSRISIVHSETDLSCDDEDIAVEMLIEDENSPQGLHKNEREKGKMRSIGRKYDEDPNEFVHGARVYIFATLLCLLKEKTNSHYLARCGKLMSTIIAIASFHESQSHVRALSILSHITRHSDNTKLLVTRTPGLLNVLVAGMNSPSGVCRTQACRGVQNLAGERSCRQEVANAFDLLESLCRCARGEGGIGNDSWDNSAAYVAADAAVASAYDERHAAVGALKNLTDEPANMIPMTNAGDCFATLMQIANGGDDGVSEEMQYMACDALATLSHWLRKIATSGVAGATTTGEGCGAAVSSFGSRELFVPSNQVIGWEQWA